MEGILGREILQVNLPKELNSFLWFSYTFFVATYSNFLYKIPIAKILSERTLETEAIGCTEHPSIAVHRSLASRAGHQTLDLKPPTAGFQSAQLRKYWLFPWWNWVQGTKQYEMGKMSALALLYHLRFHVRCEEQPHHQAYQKSLSEVSTFHWWQGKAVRTFSNLCLCLGKHQTTSW